MITVENNCISELFNSLVKSCTKCNEVIEIINASYKDRSNAIKNGVIRFIRGQEAYESKEGTLYFPKNPEMIKKRTIESGIELVYPMCFMEDGYWIGLYLTNNKFCMVTGSDFQIIGNKSHFNIETFFGEEELLSQLIISASN